MGSTSAMVENVGLNETERLVYHLCRKSFLSLWSYANPQGKSPGKELCDVLVVCEPDIIILSVKDVAFIEAGDEKVNQTRWFKRAIEESVKQIYGAERWINSTTHAIRNDGKQGLPFPEPAVRRVHRVAVALGGKDKVWKSFGDFGKGFVHVFDERSLEIVMNELNTITDFIKYLSDKEALYRSGTQTFFNGGGEEDLLALYLHNNRQFPTDEERGQPDTIILDDRLWATFTLKPEYLRKKDADRESYSWDSLLETYCDDVLNEHLEVGSSVSDLEKAARTMARENRFNRRLLGSSLNEFMRRSDPRMSEEQRVASRMVSSPSGVVYVFLTRPHGYERELRARELWLRCYVARGTNPNKYDTVIGVATEEPVRGKGYTLDTVFYWEKDWTVDDQRKCAQIQKELGYFRNPNETQVHVDEYPPK
jgi:hypothetical protein